MKHINKEKKKMKPYKRECEREKEVTGSCRISQHGASSARARHRDGSGLGGIDSEVALVPLVTSWEP